MSTLKKFKDWLQRRKLRTATGGSVTSKQAGDSMAKAVTTVTTRLWVRTTADVKWQPFDNVTDLDLRDETIHHAVQSIGSSVTRSVRGPSEYKLKIEFIPSRGYPLPKVGDRWSFRIEALVTKEFTAHIMDVTATYLSGGLGGVDTVSMEAVVVSDILITSGQGSGTFTQTTRGMTSIVPHRDGYHFTDEWSDIINDPEVKRAFAKKEIANGD